MRIALCLALCIGSLPAYGFDGSDAQGRSFGKFYAVSSFKNIELFIAREAKENGLYAVSAGSVIGSPKLVFTLRAESGPMASAAGESFSMLDPRSHAMQAQYKAARDRLTTVRTSDSISFGLVKIGLRGRYNISPYETAAVEAKYEHKTENWRVMVTYELRCHSKINCF